MLLVLRLTGWVTLVVWLRLVELLRLVTTVVWLLLDSSVITVIVAIGWSCWLVHRTLIILVVRSGCLGRSTAEPEESLRS